MKRLIDCCVGNAPAPGRWACVQMVVVAATVGCAGNVIRPHQLPPELQAPRVENAQAVDLSRLAGFSVSNEMIEPGDVLEVTVDSGLSDRRTITTPVRVGPDGMANVPLIGRVALAGLELSGAEQAIRSTAIGRQIFRDPHVTVVMERKRMNKVTVIGAVKKPGTYELPRSSSDLLAALVSAGGLSDDAGTDVEIRRPARRLQPAPGAAGVERTAQGQPVQPISHQAPPRFEPPRSVRINLVSAAASGEVGAQLRDGDVVWVMKRVPKPVHVIGLVKKPNKYELPTNQDLRLLDVIALAGGTNSPVADKVYVIRQVAGQANPVVVKLSLRNAKHDPVSNLRLAAGDVVSVEQTPETVALNIMERFIRIAITGTGRIPLF